MLRWLLELIHGGADAGPPSPADELAFMVDERRRLAEIQASYREFGFDEQAESSRIRLRQLQARIRRLHEMNNEAETGGS